MSLGNPYGAMARCIMNPDKTISYFLDPNNSDLKLDGAAVDWTTVEANGQNCMVQIPKFYYCKKWDATNQAFYFGVSSVIKDTDFISSSEWVLHQAFMKDQEKALDDNTSVAVEVPYRYASAFSGWIDSYGRLRSLPKKTPANTNLATGFAAAKTSGLGYCVFDYYLYNALQMLYLTEYAHPDIQKNIGIGLATSISSGHTLTSGNNSYGTSLTSDDVSYRGIERLWGSNIPFHIAGIVNQCNGYVIDIYATNYRYNMVSLGTIICSNPVGGSYIKTINTNANGGFFAASVSGIESGLFDNSRYSTGTGTFNATSITYGSSTPHYPGIFSIALDASASTTANPRLAL